MSTAMMRSADVRRLLAAGLLSVAGCGTRPAAAPAPSTTPASPPATTRGPATTPAPALPPTAPNARAASTQTLVAVGMRPYGLAVRDRRAYVTQLDGRTVTTVAISDTLTVVGQASVGGIPTSVAVSPDGVLLLVANQRAGEVNVLEARTGTPVATYHMPGSPYRALVSADGLRGYVTSDGGLLLVIDLKAHRAVATVDLALGPTNGLALADGGRTLYLTSTRGGIVAVDLRTNTVSRRLDVSGVLQDVAVSPDGRELYVADEQSGLLIVPLDGGPRRDVPLDGAFGLALAPDGGSIWVTQPSAGRVTVIDRASREVVRTVRLRAGSRASRPRHVAFDGAGSAIITDEAGYVHLIR
jgi:DNA-binding beta-propeller fold protein YncE